MPGVMGKAGKKKAEKKGSFFDVAWNQKNRFGRKAILPTKIRNIQVLGVSKNQIFVNPLK